MKKALIALAAVAVIFTACGVDATDEQVDVIDSTIEQPSDPNLEAARIAWDVGLSPSEQADLCAYYNTPPVGLTPPLVRAFDSEAHLGYAESERVLSTVLAEEC